METKRGGGAWKFRLKVAAVAVLLIAAAAVGVGFYLLHQARSVPEYYVEVLESEPEAASEASDEMLRKVADLHNNVQAAKLWSVSFSQDEINGWLAVDLVKNHQRSIPKGMSDPRVVLNQDEAILACRVDDEKFQGVLSVVVDVYVAGPNTLAVRLRGARLGKLPLPKSVILERIEAEAPRVDLPVQWRQKDGDPVMLIQLDARLEDGTLAEVQSVDVGEGELLLAGTSRRKQGAISP